MGQGTVLEAVEAPTCWHEMPVLCSYDILKVFHSQQLSEVAATQHKRPDLHTLACTTSQHAALVHINKKGHTQTHIHTEMLCAFVNM